MWGDNHHLFTVHRHSFKTWMGNRAISKSGIQRTVQHTVQHGTGRSCCQRKLDFRVALIIFGKCGRNTHGGCTFQRPQREQSLWFISCDHHPRFFYQRQDPLAVAQKVVPGGRKSQALIFTNKQIDAKVSFKLANTRGEVGRHAMHLRSCLRDAAGLSYGIEHFQLRQVHNFLYS